MKETWTNKDISMYGHIEDRTPEFTEEVKGRGRPKKCFYAYFTVAGGSEPKPTKHSTAQEARDALKAKFLAHLEKVRVALTKKSTKD